MNEHHLIILGYEEESRKSLTSVVKKVISQPKISDLPNEVTEFQVSVQGPYLKLLQQNMAF